ncbi:MAG TPA: hypothetical protein VF918_01955 [Anaerolineales bacterium]
MLDSLIMLASKQIRFLWITALLFSGFACRAATKLIIPDTPTPSPTATATPTLTPTLPPTFTPTAIFEAACPSLLEEILQAGTSEVVLHSDRSDQSFNEEDGIILMTYEVVGNKISVPRAQPVPDELESKQKDRDAHEAIWNYFASIVPPEERAQVSEFAIFTDGRGKHLAAVGQTFSDPKQWMLQVDILDSESYYDLTYTLLHEQGHLLTLNAEQVPPSNAIFKYPNNKTIYKQEVSACPQYFPGEGCSTPDSYVNEFFNRFWMDFYAEWEQIDLEEDEDTRYAMLEDFYKTYKDQFLSYYAPTSPLEDMAESWSFFVLSPKPESSSIANEKILFFYEYPELVELRTKILKQICVQFPQ